MLSFRVKNTFINVDDSDDLSDLEQELVSPRFKRQLSEPLLCCDRTPGAPAVSQAFHNCRKSGTLSSNASTVECPEQSSQCCTDECPEQSSQYTEECAETFACDSTCAGDGPEDISTLSSWSGSLSPVETPMMFPWCDSSSMFMQPYCYGMVAPVQVAPTMCMGHSASSNATWVQAKDCKMVIPPPEWGHVVKIMMHNVPGAYTQQSLQYELDNTGFRGAIEKVDVFGEEGREIGYVRAMISFENPGYAWMFKLAYEGRLLNQSHRNGRRVCVTPVLAQDEEQGFQPVAPEIRRRRGALSLVDLAKQRAVHQTGAVTGLAAQRSRADADVPKSCPRSAKDMPHQDAQEPCRGAAVVPCKYCVREKGLKAGFKYCRFCGSCLAHI